MIQTPPDGSKRSQNVWKIINYETPIFIDREPSEPSREPSNAKYPKRVFLDLISQTPRIPMVPMVPDGSRMVPGTILHRGREDGSPVPPWFP